MNYATESHQYPSASDFILAMWTRVLNGYSPVMSVVATAIVQAGGDRDATVRMVGNKANRAAFLMGCCAEELVSSGFVMKGREARRYVKKVIEALRPMAQPIRSQSVAPDFRRLLEEYERHPIRMRVKTIQYMLTVNGLEREKAIVAENAACQLQIECSVTVDGIAGCLIEMMESEAVENRESGAITTADEEIGPVISRALQRLS